MTEQRATPDLVALTRRAIEDAGRREFDAAIGFYMRDSVWDASSLGWAPSRVWT